MAPKTNSFFHNHLVRAYSLGLMALFVIGVSWAPQLYTRFWWNLTNVLLTHARLTDDSGAMYRDSVRTIKLLSGFEFDNEQGVQSRLLEANHLLWRSASALGFSDIGLEIYEQLGGINETPVDEASCPTELPQRFEPMSFTNVTANGLAIPRKIGTSPGIGVVLFSTEPPILHNVCLAESGIYTIAITALESMPPPIEIEVKWNGWYVGTLAYASGDDTISTKSLRVAVPSGNHLLSLRFANDFSNPASGIDRNAYIDSVEISGP